MSTSLVAQKWTGEVEGLGFRNLKTCQNCKIFLKLAVIVKMVEQSTVKLFFSDKRKHLAA